jgi:isopenicillin N synthase-like dioxygenase
MEMPSVIPVIDLSLAPSPSTKPKLLASLRHALLEVGFLYLSNHSLPSSTIQDLVDLLAPLFGLPPNVKEMVGLVKSPHFLGYSSFGHEITAGKQDAREQYEFANDCAAAGQLHRSVKGNGSEPLFTRLLGCSQYPDTPDDGVSREEVEKIVQTYISAMQDLATRFLQLVEEALQVEQGALASFLGKQDRLKLVHYHADGSFFTDDQNSAEVKNSGYIQGVGPHKDSSGWMTFLLQQQPSGMTDGKGLQALAKDGTWLDVPPIPGTFVVNMGQAFEVVTNGVCKATTHRVLLPASSALGYDRYSVPFFQAVRFDACKDDFRMLWRHFTPERFEIGKESTEGGAIDSPFLKDKYETWGEAQLRTKIRSHRDVGKKWYPEVYEQYIGDG